MPGTDMLPFGAAVASDVLSAFQLPGGSVLTSLAETYVAKKRKEAAYILIEEVSKGHHGPITFDEHDVDPLIEIIFRFSKAVSDGAAHENLRLLAQVIAGLKKHRGLEGDKFRKWAGVLENLTRDELLAIGTAYVIAERFDAAGSSHLNDFNKALFSELEQKGCSRDEAYPLLISISRTGLLAPSSGWGTLVFQPSYWLKELGKLANLEAMSTKRGV
jgi:hypothetical protein